jgi:hypothetical protein
MMMVSFCVLQTSTAHPGRRGDHRQFLTTHGTLPLSVKRHDDVHDNLNQSASKFIKGFFIKDAKFVGRDRDGFYLKLNPWLNSVIGGRGTGKSTLVELIRLTLQRKDEIPKSLESDFDKYFSISRSRNDDGLILDTARFYVLYEKDGQNFKIEWSPSCTSGAIYKQNIDGSWVVDAGKIETRFPVRIYSQKQIFELSKNPEALIKIIDQAESIGRAEWGNLWILKTEEYQEVSKKVRRIEKSLSEEANLVGEKEDIQRKLAIFESSGHADILKNLHYRKNQDEEVKRWNAQVKNRVVSFRSFCANFTLPEFDHSMFSDSPEDSQILGIVSHVSDSLSEIKANLNSVLEKLQLLHISLNDNLSNSEWKVAVESANKSYSDLCEHLTSEAKSDPSEYETLVKNLQTIESRLTEIDKGKIALSTLRDKLDSVYTDMCNLRRDLTMRRQLFLNSILSDNHYVKIEVVPYGNYEDVESAFRRLIRKEDNSFDRYIGRPGDPNTLLGELHSVSGDFENNLLKLKRLIHTIHVEGDLGSVEKRLERHIANLDDSDIDKFFCWFPDDTLDVSYRLNSRGGDYASINKGSPGQRTAALLAFLFSYGDEPIILDQPEDDLDNCLIYDLIVSSLRRIKSSRQIIVVTHNANIVVNGDSELVVSLKASGITLQECFGSLQDRVVRETICKIMEGGAHAFEQRYRRIALEGRRLRQS